MIFKANDDCSSYYALLVDSNGKLELCKFDNDSMMSLASSDALIDSYSRLNRYNLNVEFSDGNISCYYYDELLIEYVDDNYLTGNKVGAYCLQERTLFNNPSIK